MALFKRLCHKRFIVGVGYACGALVCFFCGIRPLIKEEQKTAQIIPKEENGDAPTLRNLIKEPPRDSAHMIAAPGIKGDILNF